jgi:hypothetical protein
MSTRFLAWYNCGVLLLASLLTFFFSVASGATSRFAVLQTLLVGAALFSAVVAVVLTQLPREHWVNRSFAVRCLLGVVASFSSLLLATSVG